jgi:GDPmannose 4,6-dehydratase
MYRILQQDKPEDYVIATGITTSVRDFTTKSFEELGIELEWKGSGKDEKGIVISSKMEGCNLEEGTEVISIDPKYYRPTEVDLLIGDATKARTQLNWNPVHDLDSLIEDMISTDLELMKKDLHVKEGGFKTYDYHE